MLRFLSPFGAGFTHYTLKLGLLSLEVVVFHAGLLGAQRIGLHVVLPVGSGQLGVLCQPCGHALERGPRIQFGLGGFGLLGQLLFALLQFLGLFGDCLRFLGVVPLHEELTFKLFWNLKLLAVAFERDVLDCGRFTIVIVGRFRPQIVAHIDGQLIGFGGFDFRRSRDCWGVQFGQRGNRFLFVGHRRAILKGCCGGGFWG